MTLSRASTGTECSYRLTTATITVCYPLRRAQADSGSAQKGIYQHRWWWQRLQPSSQDI